MGRDHQKRNIIFVRLTANILLFGAALFAHWAITLAILVACLFMFQKFYEAVFFGLMLDALYGTHTLFSMSLPLFTIGSILLYNGVTIFKKHIRPYD